MLHRITLLVILGMLILNLAACQEQAPKEEKPAAAAPTKAAESAGPFYELTKDTITDKPEWTSRNIVVLGAKLGDRTTNVDKKFGSLNKTTVLAEDYFTTY